MVSETRLTLDQYLALPETKPYLEYVRGELVPKAMPNDFHSTLVKELLFLLESHVRGSRLVRVDTELRHVSRAEHRAYLPDVSVTFTSRLPAERQNPVEVPPDLVIEVLSPDDRAGDVLDKADFYMRIGVALLWIVDPLNHAVTVYRPGAAPQLIREPVSLDAAPVLDGFSLPLADLFSVIDEATDATPDGGAAPA